MKSNSILHIAVCFPVRVYAKTPLFQRGQLLGMRNDLALTFQQHDLVGVEGERSRRGYTRVKLPESTGGSIPRVCKYIPALPYHLAVKFPKPVEGHKYLAADRDEKGRFLNGKP